MVPEHASVDGLKRLALQLQSLSELTEALTYRLLELDERLASSEVTLEGWRASQGQGFSLADDAELRLDDTEERLSRLEALLSADPSRLAESCWQAAEGEAASEWPSEIAAEGSQEISQDWDSFHHQSDQLAEAEAEAEIEAEAEGEAAAVIEAEAEAAAEIEAEAESEPEPVFLDEASAVEPEVEVQAHFDGLDDFDPDDLSEERLIA